MSTQSSWQMYMKDVVHTKWYITHRIARIYLLIVVLGVFSSTPGCVLILHYVLSREGLCL
jgi:hypothetical protein